MTLRTSPARPQKRTVTIAEHVCPPFCHRCPDMGGEIMPFCWGSAMNREFDALNQCSCDPTDVAAVHHANFVANAYAAVNLLRDARRSRKSERIALRQLESLIELMRGASPDALRQAWSRLADIAARLRQESAQYKDLPKIADGLESGMRESEREWHRSRFQQRVDANRSQAE